jgi:hypothetical protein
MPSFAKDAAGGWNCVRRRPLRACSSGRQRPKDIFGWFTEGFDTADLKDAKVLLAELSD